MQAQVFEQQFAGIFGSYGAIEDATVYIENLPNNGRKFVTRYSGKNGELVVKRAQEAVDKIDHYRSPSRSIVHEVNGKWVVDVTYYGLD